MGCSQKFMSTADSESSEAPEGRPENFEFTVLKPKLSVFLTEGVEDPERLKRDVLAVSDLEPWQRRRPNRIASTMATALSMATTADSTDELTTVAIVTEFPSATASTALELSSATRPWAAPPLFTQT